MDLIDFTWWRCVDGYELVSRVPPALRGSWPSPQPQSIRSKGKLFEPCALFKIPSSALFRKVAELPCTPEGMVAFANAYGLMTHAGSYAGFPRPKPRSEATALDGMLWQHARLQQGIALFEAGEMRALVRHFNLNLGKARHELRLAPNGKVFRVLVPNDLIQALWIQFAAHVESGAELARCLHCGEWHRTGTGIGRRNTLKYCSDICRKAAHRAKKEA
jgi:hypothetical protein